jgi:hypothetical protein
MKDQVELLVIPINAPNREETRAKNDRGSKAHRLHRGGAGVIVSRNSI